MGLSISLAVHNHFKKMYAFQPNHGTRASILGRTRTIFVFLFLFVSALEHREIELALYNSIFIIDYGINASLLLSVHLHSKLVPCFMNILTRLGVWNQDWEYGIRTEF